MPSSALKLGAWVVNTGAASDCKFSWHAKPGGKHNPRAAKPERSQNNRDVTSCFAIFSKVILRGGGGWTDTYNSSCPTAKPHFLSRTAGSLRKPSSTFISSCYRTLIHNPNLCLCIHVFIIGTGRAEHRIIIVCSHWCCERFQQELSSPAEWSRAACSATCWYELYCYPFFRRSNNKTRRGRREESIMCF